MLRLAMVYQKVPAIENIRWIEDALIKHLDFTLPRKKVLLNSDVKYKMVVIDKIESPIESPPKKSDTTTPEKRKGIR